MKSPCVWKRTRLTHPSTSMGEGNPTRPKSPNKQLSDSDALEEEQVSPMLKTSEKERHYKVYMDQL